MKRKLIFPILLGLLTLSFFQSAPVYSEGGKTLAVLPFTMHADRDLTFLREGIVDMLSSRLAWKDRVSVVNKGTVTNQLAGQVGPLDEQRALEIGNTLGADYIILGSLTVFGESVSIDAKIMDVSESRELMTAFNQSKGMDEVIPTINRFAQDINGKILGRTTASPDVSAERETAPIQPVGRDDQGPLVRVETRETTRPVDHVRRFDFGILSLDVGDVDGDGRKEVVFIEQNALHVYKYADKNFVPFKTLKEGWSPRYVYVSVGDMDGNGRVEIYLSNISNTKVNSFVFEWDGSKLAKVADGQPWLFRVAEIPGRGKVLLGQKKSSGGSYTGDVQVLRREGKNFVSTESLKLPRDANIFNFAIAQLEPNKSFTILLNRFDYLMVHDGEGDEIWKSSENFGGSLNSFEDRTPAREPGERREVYIPPPIFLEDADGDGRKEVVVCQNELKTRFTDNLRVFSGGKVHFLTWKDGLGLSSSWTTHKISGAVVGYALDDLDQNGSRELLIASVTGEGHFIGRQKSQLLVYSLD
jgi:TolB-like protein